MSEIQQSEKQNLKDLEDRERARIAALDPSANLTDAEAAMHLRLSSKSMQRMRENTRKKNTGEKKGETGPPFVKGEGSRGHIIYNKGMLDAWNQARHQTSYLGFAMTMWSADELGRLTGPASIAAEGVVVGTLLELISEETWADSEIIRQARRMLDDEWKDIREAVDMSVAAAERSELEQITDGAGAGSARPRKVF